MSWRTRSLKERNSRNWEATLLGFSMWILKSIRIQKGVVQGVKVNQELKFSKNEG